MIRFSLGIAVATAALVGTLATRGYAEDACAGFKWDLTQERALFAGSSEPATATAEAAAAVELAPARLYALSLKPQSQVQVVVPLGRKATIDGAFAGLARLKIAAAGPYRVSLDQSGWIDIVGGQGALAATDFSGAQHCNAPHKTVQFDLPAGELILQLTGVSGSVIKLAVTAVRRD